MISLTLKIFLLYITTSALCLQVHAQTNPDILQQNLFFRKITFSTLLNRIGQPVTDEKLARCIKDLTTGLIWELKTEEKNLHNVDAVFRWGGKSADKKGTLFYDDWNSIIKQSNDENYCGINNWRVPAVDELKTLIKNSTIEKKESENIFFMPAENIFWTASTYKNYPEHAQNIDLKNGNNFYFNGFRGNKLKLILVGKK